MASTQPLSRNILCLLEIMGLRSMSARYERKSKHLNYDGSWNVFVSESCVDSRGVAIKTMGFLKAIS
jgi:hypothetical protein